MTIVWLSGDLQYANSESTLVFGIDQFDRFASFSDVENLVSQLDELLKKPERVTEMARNGWRKAHEEFSTAKVARFIIDLTMRNDRWKEASWSEHVYGM